MRALRAVPVVLLLVLLSSCGGKKEIQDVGKAALSGAAVTVNERAADFAMNLGNIGAKNEADAPAVERWKSDHLAGLAAEAIAFANAIGPILNGKLGKVSRAQLKEAAKTARGRAENFKLMRPKLKPVGVSEEIFNNYLNAHEAGLASVADQLEKLAPLIPEDKK